MFKNKKSFWRLSLLMFCLVSDFSFAKSFFGKDISADEAYEYGRVLRAQYRNKEARAYLKFAFENGSAEGAYLYALELKNYKQTVRTDYKIADYIKHAAQLGSIKAIRYLALKGTGLTNAESSNWRKEYANLLKELIESDEAGASFEYFLFYRQSDEKLANLYLNRAVKANHSIALMVEGDLTHKGKGFYLFDFSRKKVAIEQYKKAAETNYLPAIKKYTRELNDIGEESLSFEWLQKAASKGDLASIAIAARAFAGVSETYKSVEQNLIKAKAYYDVYFDVAGYDRFSVLYDKMLIEHKGISKEMSEDQLELALEERDKLIKNSVETIYNAQIYWFDDGYAYGSF